MILVVLFVGVLIIVAAVRNSQTALFTALKTDIPDFAIWAGAIIAIGVIGVVPGLKPVSRGILALVLTVIVINNYKAVTANFKTAWTGAGNASGTGTGGTASGGQSTPFGGLASSIGNAVGGASINGIENALGFGG